MSYVKDLDARLLGLSSEQDDFTLRDACSHVHAFGGSGQGKTTGSGKMLAGAYLRAGMGGLVTAVKPEEVDLWRRYSAAHGRERSLVLFDENEGFNFLAYELGRQGGADGIGAVTECLMRVVEAAKKASPTASQRGGEPFWEDSARMILRYSIPLIYSASGTLSIGDIIRFISTAPTHPKEVVDAEWQKRSFMYEVMEAAARSPVVPMARTALQDAITYWAEQFPAIPDRTRGNIVITVATTLDRFLHGRLNRAFCGRTTLVPELTFHGAIILLAMPTLIWNEDGVIAQQLFKYMWQRAVLSRNGLAQIHRERPVFLWSDEAQETVSSYDGEFLSMCRASKCCVTYLTQSLPTYYAKLGGDNPRDAAHSLVGKFNTHIYHSNACPETNDFAARTIGKVLTRRANFSTGTSQSMNLGMTSGASENSGSSSSWGNSFGSSSGQGGGNHSFNSNTGHNSGTGNNWGSNRGRGSSESVSQGYSEAMEYAIEPGDFGRILKNGGTQNRNRVTGIWYQAGRVFRASGNNFMLEIFQQ
jgi:hypothetical protein